jgi:hypothetical protein
MALLYHPKYIEIIKMKINKPRILLIDIETFPNVSYTWGKWEQDVVEFVDHWYILSFAYKWLGDKKTKVIGLPDFKGYKPGTKDKELLKYIWQLLDEADIVIAQNGNAFDFKKINTRFFEAGMKPPSPYRTIDTLTVARRYFAFNSNKLDDLGRDLKIGRKVEHEGFPLWLKCERGDMKAWKRMKKYNRQDVELLEQLYLKERPWIKDAPNLDMWSDVRVCPKCGSTRLHSRGESITQAYVYTRYQCQDCGGWSRHIKGRRNSYVRGI